MVPVSVTTTLADVSSISFLVADNERADRLLQIMAGTVPAANPQDGEDQQTVLVEAGSKLYSADKEVKVTVGGCGGRKEESWHRPFACAPPTTATSPRCRH